jgi:hypothetical protein
MKIALNVNHVFWGLMNPQTMQLPTILTEDNPDISVEESTLEPWAIKQIVESVKKNRISISVQIEELLKSETKDIVSELEVSIKKPRSARKKVASKKLKA